MYFVVVLVAAAAVSIASVSAACPGSSDKCIDKSAFSLLSQNNATDYCVKGATWVATTLACFNDCQSSDTTGYLSNAKSTIDSFCKRSDPNCPNVTDTYVAQVKCFDDYGGRKKVTQQILDDYNKGAKTNDAICQQLYWGRNCQKASVCSFNNLLDLQLLKDNPDIVLGLACCGSEKAPALAAQIEDNSKCSTASDRAAIDSKVQSAGNIACDIAAATSVDDICRAMERQAASFEANTAGCGGKQKTYVLPRLNTYAIANKYLGCDIKIKGIETAAPAGTMCNYTNILNSCFFARAYENAIDWNRLKPLLNRDLPINDFCKYLPQRAAALSNCTQAALLCTVPQARLLFDNIDYTTDYKPELGSFPLDPFGMNAIFDLAVEACKGKNYWTDPICSPQSLEDVTNPPVQEVSSVKQTNQMRTTQAPKNPNVIRNDINSGNFQQQSVVDDGCKLPVSFVLLCFSMLFALFTTA